MVYRHVSLTRENSLQVSLASDERSTSKHLLICSGHWAWKLAIPKQLICWSQLKALCSVLLVPFHPKEVESFYFYHKSQTLSTYWNLGGAVTVPLPSKALPLLCWAAWSNSRCLQRQHTSSTVTTTTMVWRVEPVESACNSHIRWFRKGRFHKPSIIGVPAASTRSGLEFYDQHRPFFPWSHVPQTGVFCFGIMIFKLPCLSSGHEWFKFKYPHEPHQLGCKGCKLQKPLCKFCWLASLITNFRFQCVL